MKRLPRILARLGTPLLTALGLALASGLVLFFSFEPDPLRATAPETDWHHFVVSLHGWSSVSLIVLGALHAANSWLRDRFTGRWTPTYVLGSASFVLLVAAHFTGRVLRWDETGRNLAVAQLQSLAALGAWGASDESGLLANQVLVHGIVLAAALGAVAWAHRLRARDVGETLLARPRDTWITMGAITLVALVIPVSDGSGAAFPFAPMDAADRLIGAGGFAMVALIATVLLVAQPWMARSWWALTVSRAVLAGLCIAAVVGAVKP